MRGRGENVLQLFAHQFKFAVALIAEGGGVGQGSGRTQMLQFAQHPGQAAEAAGRVGAGGAVGNAPDLRGVARNDGGAQLLQLFGRLIEVEGDQLAQAFGRAV